LSFLLIVIKKATIYDPQNGCLLSGSRAAERQAKKEIRVIRLIRENPRSKIFA
jgi:hypothetical protein